MSTAIDEQPDAWRVSKSAFQAARGIATSGPRTPAESIAAIEAGNEWRRQIVMALDAGLITLASSELHDDAHEFLEIEVASRDKQGHARRVRELREKSAIWTVEELRDGEKVWYPRLRTHAIVIRTHQVSVDLSVDGISRPVKVKLAVARLSRLSPEQIEAEARRGDNSARAPAASTPKVEEPQSSEPDEARAERVIRGEPAREPPSMPHRGNSAMELVAAFDAAETSGHMAPERLNLNFEGRRMLAVRLRDQWWWPARYVGRAIEQADDGKQFVRNVSENAEDFVEGFEFIRVSGSELAAVRRAFADGGAAPTSQNHDEISDASGRPMLLLSESGLNLALMRSRTEIGKRMRIWLAREVIPSIRRTGSYSQPGAIAAPPSPPSALPMEAITQIISATVSACMEAMRPRRRTAKPRALPGVAQ